MKPGEPVLLKNAKQAVLLLGLIRYDRDITLQEVASRINCTASTLCGNLNFRQRMSAHNFFEIARVLDCDVLLVQRVRPESGGNVITSATEISKDVSLSPKKSTSRNWNQVARNAALTTLTHMHWDVYQHLLTLERAANPKGSPQARARASLGRRYNSDLRRLKGIEYARLMAMPEAERCARPRYQQISEKRTYPRKYK